MERMLNMYGIMYSVCHQASYGLLQLHKYARERETRFKKPRYESRILEVKHGLFTLLVFSIVGDGHSSNSHIQETSLPVGQGTCTAVLKDHQLNLLPAELFQMQTRISCHMHLGIRSTLNQETTDPARHPPQQRHTQPLQSATSVTYCIN